MQSIRARFVGASLILAGLAISAFASAQSRGTSSADSPCNDELYQQLRNKPRSQMTEVEIRVLERKEKACNDYEVAQVKGAPNPPPASAGANSAAKKPAKTAAKPAPPQRRPAPPSAREPKRIELGEREAFPMGKRMAFAFYGGMAPPSGKLTDYHHVGYTFGAGLAYSLNHQFSIDLVSFGVDHFPLDRAQAQERQTPPPGGSVTVLSLSTGFRTRLSHGFTVPYLAAGVGIYRAAHWDLELTPGQIIRGEDWTSVGWTIGGGVERRLGERSIVFTEARAAFASTAFEYSAYYPMRGGVRVHF